MILHFTKRERQRVTLWWIYSRTETRSHYDKRGWPNGLSQPSDWTLNTPLPWIHLLEHQHSIMALMEKRQVVLLLLLFCILCPHPRHASCLHNVLVQPMQQSDHFGMEATKMMALPWLVGGCFLGNLPGKNTHHNNPLVSLMCSYQNGLQRPPGATSYNSHPACWPIVVCGGARSGAPWLLWHDGGRHGQWGMV